MNEITPAQQNVLDDLDSLDRIIQFAELMARGRCTVPEDYQDNPGDCLAISLQAQAWGMNPFTVAQKSHVIKGKLGYEAQLVNAVITRHAPITGRPQFRYSDGWEKVLGKFKSEKGKNGPYNAPDWKPEDEYGLWCEVSATMVGEDEPRVTRMMLVQAHPRLSTQWATDPKQQLSYSCLKKWARLHCPDVILGIYTTEEVELREMPSEKDITPLKAALNQQGEKLTARTASGSPSARTETDHPHGEELAGTETTPEKTNKDHTEDSVNTSQDRTEGIRQILHEQKQVPVANPTEQDKADLATFLEVIQNCNTLDELEEAGQSFSGRIHPDFLNQVKAAYKLRRDVLKAE